MIETTISFRNFENVRKFIDRLPANLTKAGNDIIYDVATSIQKGAKMRMKFGPKSTGFSKANMTVLPQGPNTVSVRMSTPYAGAVEYGFKGHWIPREWMDWHQNTPGMRGVNLSEYGIFTTGGFVWVSKPIIPEGYYLGPATEAAVKRLPQIVDRYIKKRLK